MADVEIAQAGTYAALYEADYAAWADPQASLARCGNVAALDLEHIAEELEALRGRERRELRQRLARLMQHLLKWAYQPERRCRSWATTLMIQRSDIHAILQDSPSLRPTLDDAIPPAFQRARAWAEEETGLLHLPPDCPWSTAQILDESSEPDVPPAGG